MQDAKHDRWRLAKPITPRNLANDPRSSVRISELSESFLEAYDDRAQGDRLLSRAQSTKVLSLLFSGDERGVCVVAGPAGHGKSGVLSRRSAYRGGIVSSIWALSQHVAVVDDRRAQYSQNGQDLVAGNLEVGSAEKAEQPHSMTRWVSRRAPPWDSATICL